jgi:hypothetical protein
MINDDHDDDDESMSTIESVETPRGAEFKTLS